MQGQIVRALSEFYEVVLEDAQIITCKARGRFRKNEETPLVGDWVTITKTAENSGMIDQIQKRKNRFVRPPVANIDTMILLASAVNPVTDPFLLDRITAIAESKDVQPIICINKSDLDPGDALFDIYTKAGFFTLRTSAKSGEGIEALRHEIDGKVCAFVGNSGVGKSSILNALEPGFAAKTAEVSDKLGRGKHTTRHVELFSLGGQTQIADTPGFSSFDLGMMEFGTKEELQYAFRDFAPFLGQCRFRDCIHVGEVDCAVKQAVSEYEITETRYQSYVRLFGMLSEKKSWEKPKTMPQK